MSPADDERPPRPRRERPLVAAGRERKPDPEPEVPAEPEHVEAEPVEEDPVFFQTVREPLAPPAPPRGRPILEFAEPVADGTSLERDDHVLVTFDGPTPQRRVTVAFRFILMLPHVFWSALLGLGAAFVVIFAWFAALFTGRVPEGMADFLSRVVQYQARVQAYTVLLTDDYPPFALEARHYAVDVETSPGKLNRAAVFFRYFLLIPSTVVGTLATLGASLIGPINWLLTLILGRQPTPLFEANAAILRYLTRTNAFTFMLTAEQPNRLRGDEPAPGPMWDPRADAVGNLPDLPQSPRITRLVLSKAAKRLIVFFMVLAVIFYGVFFAIFIAIAGDAASANSDLRDSHDRLEVSLRQFDAEVKGCAGQPIACIQAADGKFGSAFERFASDVEAIDFPFNVEPATVIDDAHRCAEDLRAMATASDQDAYTNAAKRFGTDAVAFDTDYQDIAFVRYND